jgi:dolichol-phosphate mannosyltransferase
MNTNTLPLKDGDSDTRFAVVVPMFNESVGAAAFIRATAPLLETFPQAPPLVIVDDGSTDGTGDILDRLARTTPGLTVLHHEHNAGYGAGLVTGAKYAAAQSCDYVLFMDSDLTNPPDHIQRFVLFMNEGYDVIKGCRYCAGGGVVGVPKNAYLISRISNLIARLLFGFAVADATNGFRAIRTELFLKMPLREKGFVIIMEELMWARRYNCTVTNVATTLYSRSAEQRSTMFNYTLGQVCVYLKYAMMARFSRPALPANLASRP